jgi:Domain of Unknown Function (DUF1259)
LGCLSQALFSEAARSNSLKNTVWTHSWAAATEDLSDRGGFLVQFACHIQIIATGNQAIFDADEILAKVHTGEQSGTVYKITVGRDDLGMKDHGAKINARMGLNTWAAFYGTQEDAVVAGDIAMLEAEVTPVLKSLRKNGIDVVAIHHHMTEEKPLVIFLHYWGRGSADKLANSFKGALDELGKGRH